MADGGDRELEQRLSEYRERAARLEEAVREGWVTPGSGASLGVVRRWKARGRVLDALADDREA